MTKYLALNLISLVHYPVYYHIINIQTQYYKKCQGFRSFKKGFAAESPSRQGIIEPLDFQTFFIRDIKK